MTAITDYFVDPAAGTDDAAAGRGASEGDPWASVQYALDHITKSANDYINLKAGTADVLTGALDHSTYGSQSLYTGSLVICGYTSAARDGGKGEFDLNGGNYSVSSAANTLQFIDLKIHNNVTAYLVTATAYAQKVIRCELYDGGNGVDFASVAGGLMYSHLHDISGVGVEGAAGTNVRYNYFKNGASKKFTTVIQLSNDATYAARNIISIDGSSIGLSNTSSYNAGAEHNSIYSDGGTGTGIVWQTGTLQSLVNNVVSGFSGVGGKGITSNQATYDIRGWFGNAVYNCTTAWTHGDEPAEFIDDNETLGASPFALSGADTYANRLVYFAPTDTGNMLDAFPGGVNLAKGAIQPAAGGDTLNIFNARRNTMIGR